MAGFFVNVEFDLTINIPVVLALVGLLVNSVRQTTLFQSTLLYLKEGQAKHEKRLNDHDARLNEHDRRLERHEAKMEQLGNE